MAANEQAKPSDSIPPAEALFGALFEQAAVGLVLFSIGGRFLRVNPAMCRMLGYSERELLQKTHLDVLHTDDLETAAISRAHVISGKAKPRVSERRYVRKDGATVWAQVMGNVVRDAEGNALCTVMIAHDVSGLKRTAKASEQRFHRLVEMSSDWYWVQDTEFRFVEVPGLDVQDLDTDVVIGKARWEDSCVAPLPEKAWQLHRERLQQHESFSDFVFLRHDKSGELRYLSVSGEPLFDEQGEFRGYHGVGKDVTERARAQKAIEESEARYRMLFDANPYPMWVVDAETLAFLAVNDAAIRLYGYPKEKFLALSADQIRPVEDVGDLRKAFEDPGDYRQRIWRHKKSDGEVISVKVTSFNLKFEGRRARLGVIEDLSERMQAEQRATHSERLYRELLEKREQDASS